MSQDASHTLIEDTFWSISALCGEALILFDDLQEVQLCNDAALHLLGHVTLQTLRYQHFNDIFHPYETDQATSLLSLSIQSQTTFLYHKEPIYLNVSVIKAADTNWFSVVAHKDDLSIEHSEQSFEQLTHAFLSTVSHEFRTPMNGIIGFLELMKRTNLSSSQMEYAALISDSSVAMMDKIENLLTLLEVQSAQLKVAHHETNLKLLIEDLSKNYCHVALAQKKQLFFLVDPTIPNLLLADDEKIRLILKNLISNALKFSDAGCVIVVELRAKQDELDVIVEYSVRDTGHGIDTNSVAHLLEPFIHARENQKRGFDGFGVGLRLSQSLLYMMKSELLVASEKGRGSKFNFSLHHRSLQASSFEFIGGIKAAIWPEEHNSEAAAQVLQHYLEYFEVDVVQIDGLASHTLHGVDVLFIVTEHLSQARIDAIRSAFKRLQIVPLFNSYSYIKMQDILASVDTFLHYPMLPQTVYDALQVVQKRVPKSFLRVKPTSSVKKRSKILIAEDNPINKQLLHAILLQEGFDVVSVFNGEEAVERFLKEPFDLVLMDIDMPVMDGIVANRLIKEIERSEHRNKAPVIALTAHALQGEKEQILEAGLNAHLAKPIDRPFLLRVIRNYLAKEG